MQLGNNPFGNIASGLNPTTSGISNSELAGSLSDDASNTYLAALYGNDSPEDALGWLKANNPELYYQILAQRGEQSEYLKMYEDYQKNYYSLQKESLEKAGMNPWLALQNFGSIGTASVGSPSIGNATSTLKAQREAKQSEINQKLITAGGTIIGAVIGALIMALL